MPEAVLVDAVRSPMGRGKQGGALSGVHPVDLLAQVLRALADRTGIDPGTVDDVLVGCVGQNGEQSATPGRQAVLAAGWPEHVPSVTIERKCGSGQQAVDFAVQGVLAGAYDVAVAAGVESMSRVPMGSAAGTSEPFGPLAARYESLPNQGIAAELIAARWKLTRGELDEFAATSHSRAGVAAKNGAFDSEIVPFTLPDGTVHAEDETIRAATTVEGLAGLRPAFEEARYAERYPEISWSVTAGNSSPLTDGASAALVMSEEKAAELGLTPRAAIRDVAVVGSDPEIMLTAPIPATRKLLARSGLRLDEIDAYEVNEAFASVPLAWLKDLDADPERLNPRGGAIALGHPLGASGTKLLATLVNHLEATGGRYGIQTMCEGGGMANAILIERL
jgi:acetyl-CoA acyltransferase